MTNECPICERPIVDTGVLCHECTHTLRGNLIHVARLHHQIDITLTRRDRIDDPGATSAAGPLPFSQKAREATFVVGNVITTWARHVMDERGTTLPDQRPPARTLGPDCRYRHCGHESCDQVRRPVPPDADPTVRAALWLSTQADWIRHRPEAEQVADEIADAAQLLTHTIDRMPPRRYVGPCDLCGADMYAHPWASEVRCPKGCDLTYSIEERRTMLLDKVEDQLDTAATLARALTDLGQPIQSARIRQWSSRGRLIAKGTDDAGRPLYAVRDVQDLLREDERRRAKRPA